MKRTDDNALQEVDYVVADLAGPEAIVRILGSALHFESKAS